MYFKKNRDVGGPTSSIARPQGLAEHRYRKAYEGPEREYRFSPTLSLTSTLGEGR
jgi:hypothetical protein